MDAYGYKTGRNRIALTTDTTQQSGTANTRNRAALHLSVMSVCSHLIYSDHFIFFWQDLHICFLITICESVCVCVYIRVLGKHPELKRISEGTLP